MAKTPEETAEWLHRITLEGYGDGFMEAADVIRSLQSKLHQCEADKAQLQYALERSEQAFIEQRNRLDGFVAEFNLRADLVATLESRLSSCQLALANATAYIGHIHREQGSPRADKGLDVMSEAREQIGEDLWSRTLVGGDLHVGRVVERHAPIVCEHEYPPGASHPTACSKCGEHSF